jgi:autotransporter-associated beta strand protein
LTVNRTNAFTQATDLNNKVISGTGSFTQAGSGTTTLSLTNTYTGVTTVNAGTLLVNSPGSLAAGSAVTVNNGGTLGGDGTINGTVTVAAGGHIAPGASVGTLNVNNNVAVTTGIWDIELNATTPAIDLLNVTGNLTWSGTQTLNLNILAGTPSGTYTFATWTGTNSAIGTWNVVPTGSAAANHWLGGTDLWDTQANWDPNTSISGTVALSGKNLQLTTSTVIAPASVSSIYIDPSANVSVTGPASGGKQTVKDLTIGQGLGTYTAALALQAGGNLTVTGATTVRSDGTLTATDAGLITPTLNVNGGSATLGHAADNVTTANVTAGTLTVNHVGAANLTANLSGTGSLAGSAAVFQVNATGGTPAVSGIATTMNVTGGAPTFTGTATTMTITGGGVGTTGGTIGTFNSNTGAGTSTIGSGTTVTTAANVSVGTVNFNSTQANGTLAVTGGTTNIGTGAKVATADFVSGTGTVNGANPLAITNQLKLAGGTTATLTGATSFTAAGANLANNSTARTLALSGGTLTFAVAGVGAPIASGITATASSSYTPDGRTPNQTVNLSGMTGTFPNGTAGSGPANAMWLSNNATGAGTYISWDLGLSYTLSKIRVWNYNESGITGRGVKTLNLQTSADGSIWTNAIAATVDWTSIGANGTITSTGNGTSQVQGTGAAGYGGFDWTLPNALTTRYIRFNNTQNFATADAYTGISEVAFFPAAVTSVNLPATSAAATASSVLDLGASSGTHNLASLNLTAGGATTALSLKNGATLTLNGDANNNAISATGSPGQTASILPDVTSPPSLIIAAGKNVSVDPGVTLTVQSVISGGSAVTKIGTGTLALSGANTYTGTTTVSAGTLQLDGSTHASSTANIGTAGTLTGTGTINGNATLTGGGIINKSSGTIAGTLGVTGGNWNGNGTVTGLVTSSSGTFTIGNGANLTATSGVSATGGALVVNGTLTGTLDANSSTIVSGTGTVTGNATISGIHSPGNSPGIQSYGSNLSYTTGSSVTWELAVDAVGVRGTAYDGIDVGGALDFAGSTTINLNFNLLGSTVDWADTFWDTSHTGVGGWLVYDVAGSLNNFGNLSLGSSTWLDSLSNPFSGTGGTFSLAQSGSDVVLNYSVIPEPNVAALIGGFGVLALLRRRRGGNGEW